MSRRALILFAAMGVIWGIPYLLVKVAVEDLSPPVLVFGRTAIGAAVLVPLAAHRGELRCLIPYWRPIVFYTVVEMAGPWYLLARAEERLSSSLTGLLIAAVPLVGVLVGMAWQRWDPRHRRDPLGRRGTIGLLVGLIGVGLLLGVDVSARDVGSVAIIGLVVVGYALGPATVASSLGQVPPVGLAAASLMLCALAYAPFALTEIPAHTPARVIAAMVVLGLVCSAVAFILFFALIAEVGPVRATVITYINPAVSVLLGVTLLHEAFGAATAVGFMLILVGSALATLRHSDAPPTERIA